MCAKKALRKEVYRKGRGKTFKKATYVKAEYPYKFEKPSIIVKHKKKSPTVTLRLPIEEKGTIEYNEELSAVRSIISPQLDDFCTSFCDVFQQDDFDCGNDIAIPEVVDDDINFEPFLDGLEFGEYLWWEKSLA